MRSYQINRWLLSCCRTFLLSPLLSQLLRFANACRKDLPGEVIVNGHHRRPAIKQMLPAIGSTGSASPAASPSQSPTSQHSPFASAVEPNPFSQAQSMDGAGHSFQALISSNFTFNKARVNSLSLHLLGFTPVWGLEEFLELMKPELAPEEEYPRFSLPGVQS